VSCAETAEPIDLPFGLWTRVGQKKHEFNSIHQMASMCRISVVFAMWRQCAHIEDTFAPPGEYDWTVRLRRRCDLMSNYFDHLLTLSPTNNAEALKKTLDSVYIEKICNINSKLRAI